VLAIRYRHKATVAISAEAYRTPHGIVVAARPSVSSVGPFRLTFSPTDGAVITVIETLATELGEKNGRTRVRAAFAGKRTFVGQGETLTSSAILDLTTRRRMP